MSNLGLNFILNLKPVSYNLIGGNNKSSYGFLAQDVEKIVGVETNIVSTDESKDHIKSLRYTEFIGPMVKAIQEQQTLIEDLKVRNSVLEKRIQDIENKLK